MTVNINISYLLSLTVFNILSVNIVGTSIKSNQITSTNIKNTCSFIISYVFVSL